jgi:molybdopterin-guanine dinucleotide biosynthesis protein
MEYSALTRSRATKAKRAFTTRRIPARDMQTLITGDVRPVSGNLVLATVHELGKHQRIEQLNGRRALMMPGDEILVCYGNRYAPDQFEALVSDDLGLCNLVAGGGIASREVNRHERMMPSTQIMPIGLVGDADGQPLNIVDYRIDFHETDFHEITKAIKVILVVGTSMNAGKTFTAASLICGLKQSGYRVAGIKATGTGSGGDLWKMKDMGADVIMDFTDAGFASTYKAPDEEIEAGVHGLINKAAKRKCDFAIVEIADGLQHLETSTLLRSQKLQSIVSGVVFAAYDSLGARAGYQELRELGYSVLAISGQVTRSPLAIREAAAASNCPIYSPFEIQMGALVPVITSTDSDASMMRNTDLAKQRTNHREEPVVNFKPHQDESQQRESFRVRHVGESNGLVYPEELSTGLVETG